MSWTWSAWPGVMANIRTTPCFSLKTDCQTPWAPDLEAGFVRFDDILAPLREGCTMGLIWPRYVCFRVCFTKKQSWELIHFTDTRCTRLVSELWIATRFKKTKSRHTSVLGCEPGRPRRLATRPLQRTTHPPEHKYPPMLTGRTTPNSQKRSALDDGKGPINEWRWYTIQEWLVF